jgi:hypothetical protein
MDDNLKHCVLVRVVGREMDDLRQAASRIARDCNSEWYSEPRAKGTAVCFETAHARTMFRAYCAKHDIWCENSG